MAKHSILVPMLVFSVFSGQLHSTPSRPFPRISPTRVLESIYFQSAADMRPIKTQSVQFVLMGPPYPGEKRSDLVRDRELLSHTWKEVKRVLRSTGVVAVVQTDLASAAGKYWRHDMIKETGEAEGFILFDHKFEIRGLRRDLYRRKVRNILLFRRQNNIKSHPVPEFHPDAWLLFKSQKLDDFRDAYSPDLVRILVESFTDKKDLVLAPFAGTGTTVAVSLALGRRSKGFELNPKMRPLIVKRTERIAEYFQTPEEIHTYVVETLLKGHSPNECSVLLGEFERTLLGFSKKYKDK